MLPPSVAATAPGTAPPRIGGDTQGLATTNAPAGAATIARDDSVNFMVFLGLVALEVPEGRDGRAIFAMYTHYKTGSTKM